MNMNNQRAKTKNESNAPRNFWMVVSDIESFNGTKDHGFENYPLREEHRRKIQRIESGDRILFYVESSKKFSATGFVTSSYREIAEGSWPWKLNDRWTYEIGVRSEVLLQDHVYIDAYQIAPRLEYVKRWAPEDWPLAFQGNLHLLPKADFYLLEEEMKKIRKSN